MVKAELSTPNAHNPIGQLLTVPLAAPNSTLVIAFCRVTTRRWVLQAIKELGIKIVAVDTTLATRE